MREMCTGGRIRTRGLRFWRPLLYQLSYTRKQFRLSNVFVFVVVVVVVIFVVKAELMTGIEPVTSTLPRWCSTN